MTIWAVSAERRNLVVPAVLLAMATAVGLLVVLFPNGAIGIAGAALLVSLLLRAPQFAVSYLMALVLLQPLALRLIPEQWDLWLAVRRLDEFSIAAVLPFALLRILQDRRRTVSMSMVWGLAIVTTAGLIGSVRSSTPGTLVALDAFLLFKGFLFYLIVAAFPLGRPAAENVIRGLVAFSIVAGVIGIVEVLSPELVRSVLPLDRTGVRQGIACLISVFEHEGQAGWFFGFMAAGAFAFYLVRRRPALLALFAFYAFCSGLTLRRKAIGGLIVVLVVAVLFSSRVSQKLRTLLVLLMVAAVLFLGFGDTVIPVFDEGYALYVGSHDPMQVARNAMYATSAHLAATHFPLGVGFGLFGGFVSQLYYSPVYHEYGLSRIWGLSPEYSRFIMDAFWPHILGQFGVVGLGGFLVALAGVWRPVHKLYRRAADPWIRSLALAALLTLAEALMESTAESIFEVTLASFFVFGIAALARAHAADADPALVSSPRQQDGGNRAQQDLDVESQ